MWDLSSVVKESQWMAFKDPKLERKVLRFVRFNCRKLFRVDPSQIRHLNYSADSDFLLIYLTDGKQELYGFYNYAAPKFHPLTEDYLTVFDLITFLSGPGLADLIRQIEDSYDAFYAKNGEAVFFLLNTHVVADNFLPTEPWLPFTKDVIQYDKVMDFLVKQYEPFLRETKREDLELWYAPLGFSTSFQLMEVHFYLHGMNNRFYIVLDLNGADTFNFRSAIIDGNAMVIYGLWNNQDTERKDFILDSAERVRDYLRFFCWAVEGKDGHFVLPTRDEMPWIAKPDTDKGIEAFREKITRAKVTYHSDKASVDDISVIYGNNLFVASYEIDLGTGVPEMTNDRPMAADLPFKMETFRGLLMPTEQGSGSLTERSGDKGVPTTQKAKGGQTAQTKPAREQEQKGSGPWNVKDLELRKSLRKNGVLTAAQATKFLEKDHRLEKFCLRERFYINESKALIKPITIKDCLFLEDVCFLSEEHTSHFEFINCVFRKNVLADSVHLRCKLTFTDCQFNGEMKGDSSVNMHNIRTESDLIFRKCAFFGNALLTNMDIYGDVLIAGCTFSTATDIIHQLRFSKPEDLIEKQGKVPHTSANLNLSQSSINGSLKIISEHHADGSFLGCFIGGRLEATGLEVNGETQLYQCFINESADFSFSHFKRPVRFVQWWTSSVGYLIPAVQVKILGRVSFQNCHIEGSLQLCHLETTSGVDLYGMFVDQYVDIFGLKCKNLDLKFSEIRGGVYAYRNDFSMPDRPSLEVHENLELSASEINVIRFEAIDVRGEILAKTGIFNTVQIFMGWGPEGNSSKLVPRNSEVKRITFKSVSIKGDLDFSGIGVEEGIGIYNCEIDGNLRFFNEGRFNIMNELLEGLKASNIPNYIGVDDRFINLEKKKIDFFKLIKSSNLRSTVKAKSQLLPKANLEINSSGISGSLFLNNITVDGDIQLDKSSVTLDLDAGGVLKKPVSRNSYMVIDGLNIECKNFSMRNIQVGQDVRMFGLRTERIRGKSDASKNLISQGGDFSAPGAVIRGGLFLVADDKARFKVIDSSAITHRAVIEGNFDVSIATINELSFTKENFAPRQDRGANISRIDLERTLLDKLRVFEPTPQNINLTGIQVNQWDFGNRGENCNGKASDYINVFENMQFFDKQIYVDVERALRNRSEDLEANKIYRAMRLRDKKGLSLERWITNYGTNFWRTLFIWLALVIILAGLLFWFSVLKYPGPIGKHLDFGESLLYAFQSCIPLFELDVLRDVQVRNIGWKFVIVLFTILSYVVLSIALYGFSTRVSRIKQ